MKRVLPCLTLSNQRMYFYHQGAAQHMYYVSRFMLCSSARMQPQPVFFLNTFFSLCLFDDIYGFASRMQGYRYIRHVRTYTSIYIYNMYIYIQCAQLAGIYTHIQHNHQAIIVIKDFFIEFLKKRKKCIFGYFLWNGTESARIFAMGLSAECIYVYMYMYCICMSCVYNFWRFSKL